MGTQNMNQFSQTKEVGMLNRSQNNNGNIYSCLYNPQATSTDELIPGEGVKLVDLAANDVPGYIIIDERALDADAIFGVVIYGTKKNTVNPGVVIEVAAHNSIVAFEASAAIDRGADVALVLASPGQIVTATTEKVLGVALERAAAIGDIIDVLITADGRA